MLGCLSFRLHAWFRSLTRLISAASGFGFSLIGSLSTLLLVTSRVENEKSHWRENLNEYLWNLRILGKASEPISYAVNRLEGAILRGMEHALAVNITPVAGNPVCEQGILAPSPHDPSMIGSIDEPHASNGIFPTNSGEIDWLIPLVNEDLGNLDLDQFDW